MGRIFVFLDGALGDVLLSLPCLNSLRKNNSKLHVACRPEVAVLLRETGIAAETSNAGSMRYTSLYAGNADTALRQELAAYERVYVFTVDPKASLTAALEKANKHTIVVRTIPEDDGTPVGAFRCRQMGLAADSLMERQLPVPQPYPDFVQAMLKRQGYDGFSPLVTVHPGSGGTQKRWPLDGFFSLIQGMQAEASVFAAVLTGPAEDETFNTRIEAFCAGRNGVVHLVDADLVAVAALLDRSWLYVGNDSGITHLAAAVGAHVLALYGPTDPVRWRPAGPHVEVLASADLSRLTVETVKDAALRLFRQSLAEGRKLEGDHS